MTPTELAPRFFLALVVILVVCRGVSWLLGRVGQPPVVSEMLAGVLLGPSLLGLVLPGVQHALFPDALLPVLYVVGQVGLVLFMFQAGYAFRTHRVRDLTATAATVSAAGVAVPLVLGTGLVLVASNRVPVRAPHASLGVSALFVGVALAVTAFPMLARIITERGQSGTRHGSLALASGALDDVVAWLLLAGVLSAASVQPGPALRATLGGVGLVAGLWFVGRRAASALMAEGRFDERTRLLGAATVLFAAAWYTDEIGDYAVFGAFAMGMTMPQSPATDRVVATLTPVAATLFLPLFFTYSGLRTQFALLADPAVLAFALACVAVAVVGKLGACAGAARVRGEPAAVALRVGVLMNARGLMQLVALNVGLEAGIVTPALFTVLVVVALVTTLMTSPLLTWLDRRDARTALVVPPPVREPVSATE